MLFRSTIPISLKTGWLYVAGIEGFQRVKEFQLVGQYKSPHNLTINFYYDYSTTIGQTITIPVTSDPGLYQFRVHLAIQKCEAIQIEIIETPLTQGEGLSISAMGFRVGVKAGLYKLPAGASY